MRRDSFDQIFVFDVGKIFLLNLVDSLELKLVDRAGYQRFRDQLEGIAQCTTDGWWRDPMRSVFVASRSPRLRGDERFVSVAALSQPQLRKIDPLRELAGDLPEPHRVVDDAVLRAFLSSRLHKKTYWLTDLRSLGRPANADAVRDRLGLDWVEDDMYLYRTDMRRDRVASAGPWRPSALCDGTARFRARRCDEVRPRGFAGWGRTVELSAWRRRRLGAAIAGAAELIAGLGPLAPGDCEIRYLGRTEEPSQCDTAKDHQEFCKYINGGQVPDPELLYRRLLDLEAGLL